MELIQYSKARFKKNELSIDESISIDEWKELGQSLKQVEGSVQFWIGDWARFGDKKGFTGKIVSSSVYDELEEITGLQRQTIQQYKSVADSLDTNLRNENLSFNHHREVAKLSEAKQTEFLNRADEEKLSVRELRDEIRKDTHATKEIILPEGTFDIIYADPPWRYDMSISETRDIENQYPTMDVEEICALPLPEIAKDALLIMWATAPKLIEALNVMEAWGFQYKTHSIWDKGKIGMGYWFRGQHELLLIGTKGNFSPPEVEFRNSSIYHEDRSAPSVKPEFYYDWIETAFPGKRVELFARQARDGWANWGNEI